MDFSEVYVSECHILYPRLKNEVLYNIYVVKHTIFLESESVKKTVNID